MVLYHIKRYEQHILVICILPCQILKFISEIKFILPSLVETWQWLTAPISPISLKAKQISSYPSLKLQWEWNKVSLEQQSDLSEIAILHQGVSMIPCELNIRELLGNKGHITKFVTKIAGCPPSPFFGYIMYQVFPFTPVNL